MKRAIHVLALALALLAGSRLLAAPSPPGDLASARVTGQTGSAQIVVLTVGGSDASFDVSGNVNVTASSVNSFTLTIAYTDETNTARTLTYTFSGLTGTLLTDITNVTGVGPYSGSPARIRCKASTTITVATAGTFTSVTYNAEASIVQVP